MTLSYRVVGSGAPLLLIHGMGVTYSIWENLAPQLSPYYKLIMVELLGHGRSPAIPEGAPYYPANADEIEAVRRELNIERWDVLGYSLGAWAAQAYSQCYPERVNHLVLLCPALFSPANSAGLRNLIWLDGRAPSFCSWLLRSWRLHGLVRLLGFGGQDHPYAAVWTREIGAYPVETVKRLLYDLPGAGRAEFSLPPLPALFLWARQDVVSAYPRPLRKSDHLIAGAHSAPLLSAEEIAREVVCFCS